MIIQAGQNIVEVGEQFERDSCILYVYSNGNERTNPGGYWIHTMQVLHESIFSMTPEKRTLQGVPDRFVVMPGAKEFLLWPTPAKETEIKFGYSPARKMI